VGKLPPLKIRKTKSATATAAATPTTSMVPSLPFEDEEEEDDLDAFLCGRSAQRSVESSYFIVVPRHVPLETGSGVQDVLESPESLLE